VVAALTLFLAREPLMDLACKWFGGEPRKGRVNSKAKATQDETEKA
jgi:hypothetical protein